jgi:polyhydroxyalkanoate synthesis regulator protein
MEEASKRNLSLLQNAMTQIWAPFGQAAPSEQGPGPAEAAPAQPPNPADTADTAPSLQDLQRQMEEIQRQLAALTKR